MVLFKMKDWKARLKDKKFSIRVPLVLLFLLLIIRYHNKEQLYL